jgi:P-type E1-E2 ATPase
MWQDGKTVMFAAIDGQLRGMVGVADREKPEAKRVIATLHAMGIEVWMVTGDNRCGSAHCTHGGMRWSVRALLVHAPACVHGMG